MRLEHELAWRGTNECAQRARRAHHLGPEACESATIRIMVDQSEAPPRDIDALHALIRAERSALASAMAARDAAFAERDQLAVRNAWPRRRSHQLRRQ
jgi:hypothetical protein